MATITHGYTLTLLCLGAMASLMLIQILVIDAVGILRKHPPGTMVEANHDDFLFRATRAHANTNESIAVFLLLALFGLLAGASPDLFNYSACLYVMARLVYTTCYYLNAKMMRSVVFAISLIGLLGMLIACFSP